MILGMSMATFTIVHVIISLIGIIAGFVVFTGFIKAERLDGWNALFLLMTVLTSVTGFMFPNSSVTPAMIVGAISLVVLAIAFIARYPMHFAGNWRWVYVVTAAIAQYLNFAVLIIQSFQKLGPLQVLAPTQSEPPFLITQGIVLVLFVVLGILAVRRSTRPALV
jgi:hypothetical protein